MIARKKATPTETTVRPVTKLSVLKTARREYDILPLLFGGCGVNLLPGSRVELSLLSGGGISKLFE